MTNIIERNQFFTSKIFIKTAPIHVEIKTAGWLRLDPQGKKDKILRDAQYSLPKGFFNFPIKIRNVF